ncbi:MAG: hypothetical protein M0Q94_10280 [Candidatus Cloacimonetes bacterium]|nr:hypothetical protein [Candidatus Cloacimonadota bacterium]
MDNLNLNNVFGKPVKYKNIKLYPIKITDMLEFYNNVNCLTINKNKFPDVEIIKMSYLLFLFVISYQEPKIIEMLNKTLNMVLKDQEFKFFFENEQLFLKVNNIIINDFEFDNIKNIILQQNLLNVEQILDPTLEKRLREAEEFLANKNKSATLEERIIAYHCVSGMKYEDIEQLTIYQFNKGLERMQLIKNFEVYTYPLIKGGSGDKVSDWLSHIEERGRYDHVLISESEFSQLTKNIN